MREFQCDKCGNDIVQVKHSRKVMVHDRHNADDDELVSECLRCCCERCEHRWTEPIGKSTYTGAKND